MNSPGPQQAYSRSSTSHASVVTPRPPAMHDVSVQNSYGVTSGLLVLPQWWIENRHKSGICAPRFQIDYQSRKTKTRSSKRIPTLSFHLEHEPSTEASLIVGWDKSNSRKHVNDMMMNWCDKLMCNLNTKLPQLQLQYMQFLTSGSCSLLHWVQSILSSTRLDYQLCLKIILQSDFTVFRRDHF